MSLEAYLSRELRAAVATSNHCAVERIIEAHVEAAHAEIEALRQQIKAALDRSHRHGEYKTRQAVLAAITEVEREPGGAA